MNRSYKLDLDGLDGISEIDESADANKVAGLSKSEIENRTPQTGDTNFWLGITAGIFALALIGYLIFIMPPSNEAHHQTEVASTTIENVTENKSNQESGRNSIDPKYKNNAKTPVESVTDKKSDNELGTLPDLQKQPTESIIVQEDQQGFETASSDHRSASAMNLQEAIAAEKVAEKAHTTRKEPSQLPHATDENKGISAKPSISASSPIDKNDSVIDNVSLKKEFVIPFRFNKTRRTDFSKVYLSGLREFVDRCPTTIQIVGHTCNVGPSAANLYIGRTRADSIRKLLLKMGIAADRVNISSAGEQTPVAPNSTRSGRALNRRVVVSCPNQSGESEKIL